MTNESCENFIFKYDLNYIKDPNGEYEIGIDNTLYEHQHSPQSTRVIDSVIINQGNYYIVCFDQRRASFAWSVFCNTMNEEG